MCPLARIIYGLRCLNQETHMYPQVIRVAGVLSTPVGRWPMRWASLPRCRSVLAVADSIHPTGSCIFLAQVEHDELLHISFHKLRSFPRRKLHRLQQTVAAGLLDSGRNAQEEQQQPKQQPSPQASRRRRLLSFGRLSRQQSACEVAAQPSIQQASRWRQRLSKVNIRARRRGPVITSGQGTSFSGGSHTPEVSCAGSARDSSTSRLRSAEISRPSAGYSKGFPEGQQPDGAPR